MADRRRLTPEQVYAGLSAGRLRLVDIRRPDEWLLGTPDGAEHRSIDELIADSRNADPPSANRHLVLVCETGRRSGAGVERLRDVGIEALDVEGGLCAWRDAGLPLELPPSPLDQRERERYRRHIALPEFGERGQLALKASRVLVIGCGGLGSPAALYLAAAGVGRITLIDDDVVERSNLQRQVLHDESSIGRRKVDSARERLQRLNPDIRVEIEAMRFEASTARKHVEAHDLVLDGSDNFETRQVTNAACLAVGRPLVYGAVERFGGQVGLFRPGAPGQSCYHCLFPDLPGTADAPSCAEAGVLGVLPGVIGAMQALEAIKWLSAPDRDAVPTGWVAVFDGRSTTLRTIRVPRDPACSACASTARRRT